MRINKIPAISEHGIRNIAKIFQADKPANTHITDTVSVLTHIKSDRFDAQYINRAKNIFELKLGKSYIVTNINGKILEKKKPFYKSWKKIITEINEIMDTIPLRIKEGTASKQYNIKLSDKVKPQNMNETLTNVLSVNG